MTVKDLKGMLAAYPEEMGVTQMCIVLKTEGGDMTMVYPSSAAVLTPPQAPAPPQGRSIQPTDSLFNG